MLPVGAPHGPFQVLSEQSCVPRTVGEALVLTCCLTFKTLGIQAQQHLQIKLPSSRQAGTVQNMPCLLLTGSTIPSSLLFLCVPSGKVHPGSHFLEEASPAVPALSAHLPSLPLTVTRSAPHITVLSCPANILNQIAIGWEAGSEHLELRNTSLMFEIGFLAWKTV